MNQLKFLPVTAERWQDLETLFGKSGAYGNCWCMWWRMKRSEFDKQSGPEKKQALKNIVDANQVPGILAFANGEPVAWCSVAPREVFASLERSPTLKRVDREPVWSIVCFFVAKLYRRQGLMVMLLKAAIDHAKSNGAKIVEGYPIEPRHDHLPEVSSFTGVVTAFQEVGFVEVLRRSEKRPIMRYFIEQQPES
ncbi:MAG TPA: GNAT family N-acetyltransferase [Ktedonobacteraceae bacterium]